MEIRCTVGDRLRMQAALIVEPVAVPLDTHLPDTVLTYTGPSSQVLGYDNGTALPQAQQSFRIPPAFDAPIPAAEATALRAGSYVVRAIARQPDLVTGVVPSNPPFGEVAVIVDEAAPGATKQAPRVIDVTLTVTKQ